MVGAGETVEATLGWVEAASCLGETEPDPPGVEDVATAGEVEGASAVALVASGGAGGLLAVFSAVVEQSGSPPSTGGAADPDEGALSASEVPLGGVGGVEVQLAAPAVQTTLSTLKGVAMGATGLDGSLSSVAVTLDAASARDGGPDDRTIKAAVVGVQDTTPPAEGVVSELAFAGGVFTAAVIEVVVVVVTVTEVVARAGGCDVEAKCWLVAAAAASVMSTEAAVEDDREESCCESFLAGGGSATVVVAGETISGETL